MIRRLVPAASLAVLLIAGSAVAAEPAACRMAPAAQGQSSNAFERLVALTGEQRGLGGTGVVAQREERGLGGTGIVGVVTGFGSICVNGYEVQMAAATAVTVEGLPANDGDVRLGQVVSVEAFNGAGGLTAAKVDVTVAVAGPVSAIAGDRSQLTVAGQSVAVAGFAGSADISAVRRGDWVVVSGLRRADDSIAGTSIVKLPRRGREVFVSGIARTDAGRVEIGGLRIAAAQVAAGATVAVRGPLTGGALRARSVRTLAGFSQPMTAVSVQAYGPHVATELRRLGVSGAAAPVDAGAPTQVEGAVGAGGALVPQRIESAPIPTEVPVRPAAAPPTVRPEQTPAPAPGRPPQPQPVIRPAAPLPPRPVERPAIPDVVRPAIPERVAPPVRPERPTLPDRPQRPD